MMEGTTVAGSVGQVLERVVVGVVLAALCALGVGLAWASPSATAQRAPSTTAAPTARQTPTPATTAPATRRAAVPLTLGGRDFPATDPENPAARATGAFRLPVLIAPTVHRWRVHVSAYHLGRDTVIGSHVQIGGVWAGPSAGGGSYSGPATQVLGSATLPQGRDGLVSQWQTLPLGGGKESVLGYSVTGYATPPSLQTTFGWRTEDAHRTEARGAQATAAVPLEIWLEVEVDATTPVVMVLGDSMSVGAVASRPVYDAPANRWARAHGAIATIMAGSGMRLHAWAEGGPRLTRFADLRPDVVVISLGTNDTLLDRRALRQLRVDDARLVEAVTTAYRPAHLYLQTQPPATTVRDPARENLRRARNAWLRAGGPLPHGSAGGVLDVVPALSPDDETLHTEFSADGLHLSDLGNAQVARVWGDLGLPPRR